MNKTFLIGGTIIDDDSQAWAYEDVTPAQVRAFMKNLADGEGVTFEISSPGGSVTAGIAIANLIREASRNGHATKAHVIGIAASMASVIACACDEIDIDESAFMMIHNPWTMTQGDAEDLRKSADVLDQMKTAILSFYRSKFDKTDDELKALMDDETWFTGASAKDFGFKANVLEASEGDLKVAACARKLPNFAKMPQMAEHLFAIGKRREAPEPTSADGSENADEHTEPPKVEPPKAEPPKVEPVVDDAEKAFTERLANAMRSRDKEINDLKIALAQAEKTALETVAAMEKDFQDKLAVRDKELTEAKAEITRLGTECEKAKKELKETSSALDASNQALATLNASVNTPSATATRTVNARAHMASLPAAERQAFYSAHRDAVDGNETINI